MLHTPSSGHPQLRSIKSAAQCSSSSSTHLATCARRRAEGRARERRMGSTVCAEQSRMRRMGRWRGECEAREKGGGCRILGQPGQAIPLRSARQTCPRCCGAGTAPTPRRCPRRSAPLAPSRPASRPRRIPIAHDDRRGPHEARQRAASGRQAPLRCARSTAHSPARGAGPPPLPPPSRTNWTRLVPPSVLTGHVS